MEVQLQLFKLNGGVKMKKQKSLRQLARELQISPAYLSMILSGQRNPNAQLKDKLCSLGLFTSEAMNCGSGKALAKEAERRSLKE